MAISNGVKHNKQKSTEIILEYLEKFPESPSKGLARKIFSEYPTFNSYDAVYGRVRYYRGQMGKVARNHLKDKSFQKELKTELDQAKVEIEILKNK